MSNLPRLSQGTLTQLPPAVAVPGYDRTRLARSIVHIGVGGFHRAHLASYVSDLAKGGHTDWGIVGAGILDSDEAMRDALQPQDYLYTLAVRGPTETRVEVIGTILDYVLASTRTEPLIAAIADSATQIVSLTVTEGGYPVDAATNEFDPDSPVAGERSAFGLIARCLAERRRRRSGPLTILSCDNVLSNGDHARIATLGESAALTAADRRWIQTHVSFPNSMVDRITPATTDTDRRSLADEFGFEDAWPVVTEPFCQWVIEDNFAAKRPPLEELHVVVTDDVAAYEQMKLRLLNASHSAMAYLSALRGHRFVHEAIADPVILNYVNGLLRHEAVPVLAAVPGVDFSAYVHSLIARYSNPNIADQISRLCVDGTAKFPKFLMPTIAAQLDQNGPITLSALALAGWCQYLLGIDEFGNPIDISPDPHLDEAESHARASLSDPARFLDYRRVFPPAVAEHSRFRSAFVAACSQLRSTAVTAVIRANLPLVV